MFSRTSKIAVSSARRLLSDSSNPDQLSGWIKIYGNMRKEAGEIAETAISSTKIDVAVLRTEVSALRTEVNGIKIDVNDLRKGQVEIHKQINNSTRLILGGVFGTATLFFAANRYFDENKGNGLDTSIKKK